jgi:hypothetical protein
VLYPAEGLYPQLCCFSTLLNRAQRFSTFLNHAKRFERDAVALNAPQVL